MQSYPFIFSEKYRLRRHFLFWFCWWAFASLLYSYTAGMSLLPEFKRLPVACVDSAMFLIPHMFLAYSLMYFVVPRLLLKGRYLLTAISVLVLFFITANISAAIGVYILDHVRNWFFYIPLADKFRDTQRTSFFLALLAGLRGGITIAGLATCIKLMKYWYVKEQRNMQLLQENTEAQLQILKAQVHPHFLFNTLNNIYSYTQNTSAIASQLTLGLSDMLRYMIYECKDPLVPLSKEVKMLKDYITLEKIRYGNALDVNIELPDNTEGIYIAPLLLLPFVENSFKHGASQMLDQPWISLTVTLNDNSMYMKLINGKAANYEAPVGASGIGIENVRRRLELLYPGKHSLKIVNHEEVFIVNLKLQLHKVSDEVTQPSERRETAVQYE